MASKWDMQKKKEDRISAQQNKAKEQEKTKTQERAKEIQTAVKNTGLVGSKLMPITLMRRDAQAGITTQDKIDTAKGSGLAGNKSASEISRQKEAEAKKQEEKQKEQKGQQLSKYDLKELTPGGQQIVREAKVAWEKANAAGDQEGMRKAHEKAEAARRQAGYSGGAGGDEYNAGEITEKEKAVLTPAGERLLRAARMSGDERRAQDILASPLYNAGRQNAGLDAHGRTGQTGATMTTGEFARRLDAGAKAAAAGAMGSVLALGETAAQATNNRVLDTNRAEVDRLANDLGLWKARLNMVQQGQGLPEWGSESYIQNRIKIAENAQEMRSSATTVDPNLPGQSAMRQARQWQEEATRGLSGVDRLLANTAISGGQMLPGIAASFIPVAGPAIGAGIMGAQAAGSKAYDLTDRGLDAGEALTRGLASGLIEGATERIGIGNLVRMVNRAGGASFLKNIAQQMGIEATEESASYVLNYAADKAYQDPEAKFSLRELAESAASGAILGGTFGGAGTAINRAMNRPAQTTQRPQGSPQEALLQASGFYDRQAQRATEEAQEAQNAQTQAESLRQANQELQTRLAENRQRLEQIRQENSTAQAPLSQDNSINEEGEIMPIETGTLPGDPSDTISPPELRVTPQSEPVNRELPEGQGAMSRGGAGDFATWQSETPGGQFHAINEQGSDMAAELYGRAPVEVPTRDPRGMLTSKTVSTLANAGITNNQLVQSLEADAVSGGYSYDAYSDPQAQTDAENYIREMGYQRAKEAWIADAKAGKLSKKNTALGLTLINNAANSGTLEGHIDAHDLIGYYVSYARTAGQALQAMNMVNKMTPTGQLYTLTKVVEHLESQVNERGKSKVSPRQREIVDIAEQAREEALGQLAELERALRQEIQRREDAENVLLQAANAFREAQSQPEFNGWVSEIANELSENLSRRYGRSRETIQPISRIILSDLVKFAEDRALPRKTPTQKQKRTSAERIADYFQNREEYDRAWAEAQAAVREKYKDNPDALSAFEDWLSSGSAFSVSADSNMVLRAISETIVEEEISKIQRDLRSVYDLSAFSNQIFSKINQTVDATGDDAVRLQASIHQALYNQAQDVDSDKRIEIDTNKAMREIGVKMRDIIKRGAKTKQEVADKIAAMLVSEYGISADGANKLSEDVVLAFNNRVAEASMRELESRFQDRPKRGKKTAEQRFREMANLGAFSSSRFNALATEKLTGYLNVTIDPTLVDEFLSAETQEARDAIKTEIYKDIARQVPNTFMDKANAWRYLAMLGNPRTHVRNIFGNLFFDPVRTTKNVIGAGLERLTGVEDRTKALNTFTAEDRARYRAAQADFVEVQDVVMSGGKYNDDWSQIDEYRRIFNNPLLEGARKANAGALEAEDRFFSRRAYADSLSGWLKANGFTGEEYLSESFDPAERDQAREYAIKEAQKATYRDLNAASELVLSAGQLRNSQDKAKRAAGFFVEGVLPFKKTPTNILVRGLEYSPAGLTKGVVDAATKVRRGEMDAAEAIDEIAAGLTGTGLLALGAGLAAAGLVTGGASGDEKQDEFNELQGHQNYAFETGDMEWVKSLPIPEKFQNYLMEIADTSYTIDWLAPEALPFFVGVELYKFVSGLREGKTERKDWAKAVTRIAEPMLEMSMLQSLNDVINSVGADVPLVSAVASAAMSYLGQFVPTLGGQIERTFLEDTRQSTYVDRDSAIPTSVQYMLGTIGNKIPGVDFYQREYVDAWGRPESTGTILNRALSNFFSPGYASKINSTGVDQELQRLYDAGFDSVFPTMTQTNKQVADRTSGQEDAKRYMTADEFNTMQTTKGQTAFNILDKVIRSDSYRGMSDQEKAKLVDRIYDYAGSQGDLAVDSQKEVDNWVTNAAKAADVGMDIGDFFVAYNKKNQIDSDDTKDASQKALDLAVWIDQQPYTADQKSFLKDSLKIYSHIPANTDRYEKGVAAGLTPDQARNLTQSAKANNEGSSSLSYDDMYNAVMEAAGGDTALQEMMYQVLKPKNYKQSWATVKANHR